MELTFSASVQRGITSYFRLVISSLSTIIFISVQNQKLGLCNLILAVNILGVHITCIVFHSRLLPTSAKDFCSSPKKKTLIKMEVCMQGSESLSYRLIRGRVGDLVS